MDAVLAPIEAEEDELLAQLAAAAAGALPSAAAEAEASDVEALDGSFACVDASFADSEADAAEKASPGGAGRTPASEGGGTPAGDGGGAGCVLADLMLPAVPTARPPAHRPLRPPPLESAEWRCLMHGKQCDAA